MLGYYAIIKFIGSGLLCAPWGGASSYKDFLITIYSTNQEGIVTLNSKTRETLAARAFSYVDNPDPMQQNENFGEKISNDLAMIFVDKNSLNQRLGGFQIANSQRLFVAAYYINDIITYAHGGLAIFGGSNFKTGFEAVDTNLPLQYVYYDHKWDVTGLYVSSYQHRAVEYKGHSSLHPNIYLCTGDSGGPVLTRPQNINNNDVYKIIGINNGGVALPGSTNCSKNQKTMVTIDQNTVDHMLAQGTN